MLRIVSILLLLAVIGGGLLWFSAQSLPSWYDESQSSEDQAAQLLSEQIRQQGVQQFLGSKIGDIIKGRLELNQVEFNGLFLASLKNNQDGRLLLSVSDAVKAVLHNDQVELGAIINLDKVEKINPKARQAVEKVNRIFPFLNDSKVALTVYGTPVVRNGQLGVKDDFHIKVGAIPISNDALRQLGAKVERANTSNLKLRNLRVNSVDTLDGKIVLGVLPSF